MLPAESLLAGREQQQQQDKEGKRKLGASTDPLPKSQGTVELALQLLQVSDQKRGKALRELNRSSKSF
jgi:hypothetical protein